MRVDLTEYDAAGNPVRAVDPNLHVTTGVFDGANRLLSQTRGDGTAIAATTTHKWDAAGQEVELKGPRATGVSYDVRTTYDDLGRAVRVEDALGHVTTRFYDGVGNLKCEKAPKGNEASPPYAHGTTGLASSVLSSAACQGAFVTKRDYDETSHLLRDIDALGGETSFVYSRARDVLAKQDANGHLTTYEYDKLHRRTGEFQHLDAHGRLGPTARVNLFDVAQHEVGLPVDGGLPGDVGTLEWISNYDANGNLEDLTDPRGFTEHHVYGLLNRLASTTYPNAQGRSLPALDEVVYTYTKNGSVKTATEKKTTSAGVVSEPTIKDYDGLERLKSETRYDGKVVGSTYDAKGNRLSVTEGGLATTYTFDALDRLSTATTPEGTTKYDYFPDGLLSHTKRPQSTRLDEWRCYDAAGRLSRIQTARGATGADANCNPAGGALVSDFAYQYDANGNRATLTETRTSPVTGLSNAPGEVTTYGYDELDRLVRTDAPEGTTTFYAHDAVGNRAGERKALTVALGLFATFLSVDPGALTSDVTATFNRADWLVSRTDAKDPSKSVTFGYDLAGNVTSKTKTGGSTRTFRWDARNTLTAVFDDGLELGRYDYDRNFQRVKRTAGGTKVEYILDDSFVLAEADGSQAGHPETRRYHYSTQPLEVVDGLNTSTPQARLLGNDAQGSVSDFIDFTGNVTAIRQYDPWGNFRSGTAPAIGEAALAYTGHQFDAETGLIYARARYYDSEYGIFLSRDTVEGNGADAPSLHRYLYTRGNPLRYTDPSGNQIPPAAEIPPEVEGTPLNADGTLPQGPGAQGSRPIDPNAPPSRVVRPYNPPPWVNRNGSMHSDRDPNLLEQEAWARENLAKETAENNPAPQPRPVQAVAPRPSPPRTDVVEPKAAENGPGETESIPIVNTPKPGSSTESTPAEAPKGGVTLYRAMKESPNGGPQVGQTARTLGVRPGPGENTDLDVTPEGKVEPETGGMSVTPNSPAGLPPIRRPPSMGGRGKDPVWCMGTQCLPEGLTFRPDPKSPETHGFVEPTRSMSFEEYQQLIESTQASWEPVK